MEFPRRRLYQEIVRAHHSSTAIVAGLLAISSVNSPVLIGTVTYLWKEVHLERSTLAKFTVGATQPTPELGNRARNIRNTKKKKKKLVQSHFFLHLTKLDFIKIIIASACLLQGT